MPPIPQAPEAPDEILTTRRIAAPRALVFQAFTSPEHVGAWWGPDGFTTITSEMHVAPGGTWRFVMRGPDGKDWPNLVTYVEVVAPERLVYDHGDGAGPPQFHVVVTFEEDDGGTFLAMRAKFKDAAARQYVAENFKAVEGGRQTVARLAAYVATLLDQARPE